MKKTLLFLLLAICLSIPASAITAITGATITDSYTAIIPERLDSSARIAIDGDPSGTSSPRYTFCNRNVILTPTTTNVGHTFSGTIKASGSIGTGGYNASISGYTLVYSYPFTEKFGFQSWVLGNTSIYPDSTAHHFSLSTGQQLNSTSSGVILGDKEFEFTNCSFAFRVISQYNASFPIIDCPYAYRDYDDYSDYSWYPPRDKLGLTGVVNVAYEIYHGNRVLYSKGPAQIITGTIGDQNRYNHRAANIDTTVPVACTWTAQFSNRYCSVGSIESLSFRGCGGANASFNGTVSKALDIQNSNLTNLSFNMSNAANVTGSSANVSGSMNLTTLGNLTLSDSTINSASFNGVSGAANLQRVSGNSLTLNHTGSTLNMTTISTSGNTTISHQSGTPFKLKDFTVGSFNLNYKSTNVPDDVAVQPGSTSAKQVAEIEKLRVNGGSTINGTNDSYLFMKQCTATGTMNFQNNQEVYIDGGTYKGSPAITGNNVTIKRGTLTDTGSTTSKFMVDPESDAQVATSNGQTITTVKLSNPPVIIDWADFPGIDLSVDLSAPVIEVIRTPGDSRTPTDKVTLQIGAVDPSGLKDKETGEEVKEAYVSINGGKFTQVFEGQYIQYDVTENQTVSITARDANGNVRDYNVVISNIDERPPEVKGFEQSTDNWTKGTVRVYVNAEDDVKLDPNGAYRYTFTPTDGGTAITTDWTRDRFYTTDKNGTLVVEVRDAVGKTTTSDSWLVSNIDIIAPDFTVELTPDASIKASEKDGVLLTINPNNLADPVTQEASPLANLAVKWDPAEPWSSDFERMVYENGVYNIQIRDSVGNISNVKPITVSNISDQKPRITSFVGDNLAAAFVPGPVVLTVNAESSDGTPLPDRPYSWDGGKTWTSQNTLSVSYNGEYEVTVRDGVGNTVSDYCLVKNIDSVKPTANVYLYKGQPSDWAGPDPATIDDYVWKIRIDTEDIGSGVAMVKTLWNNGAYTTNTTGLTFDVVEAGVFGVLVYDKAGNETYAEKTVTWESIGESAGGSNSNAYVGISAPSTGTAGSPFEDGTSIADVVYGPDGAYNKKTGEFKPYTPGQEGIVVDLIANSKTNKWISGYATFEGVNYPIKFKDAAGNYVEGPVKGGKNMPCRVYIPISGITKDVKNGRLVTVFQEWDDAAGTQLNREGSETLYTSVQVNPPYIQWSYDKTTGELTISPNSPVAGIPDDGIKYALDGGAEQGYTGPFIIPDGTGVIDVRVVDNAGNETTLHLDTSKLPVSGSGGGNLPTEGADGATGAGGGAVNSYYMAGRTSESYIIGGTRNNTNSIPSSDVFSSIVGSTP